MLELKRMKSAALDSTWKGGQLANTGMLIIALRSRWRRVRKCRNHHHGSEWDLSTLYILDDETAWACCQTDIRYSSSHLISKLTWEIFSSYTSKIQTLNLGSPDTKRHFITYDFDFYLEHQLKIDSKRKFHIFSLHISLYILLLLLPFWWTCCQFPFFPSISIRATSSIASQHPAIHARWSTHEFKGEQGLGIVAVEQGAFPLAIFRHQIPTTGTMKRMHHRFPGSTSNISTHTQRKMIQVTYIHTYIHTYHISLSLPLVHI